MVNYCVVESRNYVRRYNVHLNSASYENRYQFINKETYQKTSQSAVELNWVEATLY